MPRRIVLFAVLALCLSFVSPAAKAADSVTFQNRLGVDATTTWVAGNGQEPVKIQDNVPDGGTFSVPADTLRGCDRLLVQPYFDSSFQFFLPFTLDQAGAVNYSSPAPGNTGDLLAPMLVTLVGNDRVGVPAGLPLRRLVSLMAGGMNEEAVEEWLVALRLPGEKAGRYAVAVGETTWGYRDEELLFADSISNEKQVAEIWLSTPWAPKALPGILADMRESGLRPLSLAEEGQDVKAFGQDTSSEGAWTDIEKLLANTVSGADSGTRAAAELVLASDGLRHTLTLNGESGVFILHIIRE